MGQLVSQKDKALSIRQLLDQRSGEIAKANKSLDVERFKRMVLTNFAVNQRLYDCSAASIMACVMQAAQWGMELDPVLGLVYMVPYKDHATLIIGYRGYLELARRHPSIAKINARLVYANDTFEIDYGLHPNITHKPMLTGDRGPLTGAYAVWTLRGVDEPEFVYMTRNEIEEVRKRSRARNDGPWVTDYDMMCLKSVIRRSARFWPMVPDLSRLVIAEEQQELGINTPTLTDLDALDGDTAPEPKALADTLPPVPDSGKAEPAPQPELTEQELFALDAELAAKEAAATKAPEHVPHPSPPTVDPAAREDIRKEHDRRHEPRKAR